MNAWHRYLFQPVAAVRPRLFAQLFLAIVALDIWLTFVHRGPHLGVGGFVVAHFQWLDELQPVPTPALYICMMIVTSFSLWVAALCGGHRLLIALGCVLFSYGWMMSQTDSFQHHYLMSLILFCLIFFPTRQAIGSEDVQPLKCTSAWPYIVLGTQVGIVYFWTTITKVEPVWLSGEVVERLTTHPNAHPLLQHTTGVFESVTGLDVWRFMAIVTIVMETALAFGYFYAVGQDRRSSRLGSIICVALWVVTLILHIGILLMPLSIGLFGYYMLVVGTIFLVPGSWLGGFDRFVVGPITRCGAHLCKLMNPSRSWLLAFAQVIIVAAGLSLVSMYSELPGAFTASFFIAAILLAYTIRDWRLKLIVAAQHRVLAALLFLAMASTVMFGSTLRHRVNLQTAYMQHMAGDPVMALKFYIKVASQRHSPEIESGLYNNMGDIMCRLQDYPAAIEWYETALLRDPQNGSCHANLALALLTENRYDEAIEHYVRALELEFNTPSVHYNYAFALQSKDRIDEAIHQYRIALYLDKDLLEGHNNLAVLLLATKQLTEARHHLREVLRLDPEDAFTMNNLAWMLATDTNRTPAEAQEAAALAERAVVLTQRQNAVVLGTLAESYFALGRRIEAVAAAEEAIRVAESQQLANIATQIRGRLERYRG